MDDADVTRARSRILLVLHKRFGGVQVRMAAAAGVVPSLVNKVIKGVQPPTEEFLQKLGRLPGVNEAWMLTGEGEMDAVPAPPPHACPVTSALLPGDPKMHARFFSGELFPAVAEHAAGCYYHRVEAGNELLLQPDWGYRRGDLILLQTDPALIQETLTGHPRLCVVDWAADAAGPPAAAPAVPVPARLVNVAGVGWVFQRGDQYVFGLYDMAFEFGFLGPFAHGRAIDSCKVAPVRAALAKAAAKSPEKAKFAANLRMITPRSVLAMEMLMVRRRTVDG